MYYYKNLSRNTKTYHDVVCKPGEIKGFPGYVNDIEFLRVQSSDALGDAAKKSAAKLSQIEKAISAPVKAASSGEGPKQASPAEKPAQKSEKKQAQKPAENSKKEDKIDG